MAAKTVRVRLNRSIRMDGAPRERGYETTLPEPLAEQWAKNGRITILSDAKARPDANKPDPTRAPQSGSLAGSGAQLSSSRPARAPRKPRST